MWNPLTPAEVVAAIGATAREQARLPEALDTWEKGQLMSVYSATRHLAAELGTVAPHVPRAGAALAATLRAAPVDLAASLEPLAAELDGEADPRALGDTACRALDVLRASADPAAAGVRAAVHADLAAAVRLETEILADAIEGARA